MDIVYPLKQFGSRFNDDELRLSLRGVHANLRMDIGRLFIFGYTPQWLVGEHTLIRMEDRGDKAMNLRAKYAAMCDLKTLSDPFLLLDDDHMFLQPTTTVALHAKGPLSALVAQYRATAHGRYLRNCLDVLVARGLPSRNYQIHYPLVMDKAVLRECVALMRKPMVMGSLYGNIRQWPTTEVQADFRLNTPQDWERLRNGHFVSLAPRPDDAVMRWLAQCLPEPSRWEQPVAVAA